MVTWAVELTVMVSLLQVLLDGLASSDEVGDVDQVGDVGVQVVLEVLKHVHVLVHDVVSSHSWEGKGGIVKLPGVDSWERSLLDVLLNGDSVVVVLSVEGS